MGYAIMHEHVDFRLAIKLRPILENQYHSDPLMGEIYFIIQNNAFPARNWRDNVLATIEVWLDSLIPFAEGEESIACLPFLNGPYTICVEEHSNAKLLVKFIDSDEEKINLRCQLCREDFFTAFKEPFNTILDNFGNYFAERIKRKILRYESLMHW